MASALLLGWLGALSCAPRPTASVPGIELEDPNERAGRQARAENTGSGDGALVAAGGGSFEPDDSQFVHSRGPVAERAREEVATLLRWRCAEPQLDVLGEGHARERGVPGGALTGI